MGNRMRVCHVVNHVKDTGTPPDLATEMAPKDDISGVGILSWFGVEDFRNRGRVAVHCLDIPNGQFRLSREQYHTLADILSQYDVIHTHHNHSGFYSKLVGKQLGKQLISTEHNNHRGFTKKGRVANGLTNWFVHDVVCVSESVRESFKHWEKLLLSDDQIHVIENGAALDRIEAAKEYDWSIHDAVDIDPDAVVVGSAGMLNEQKAHDVLIDAVDAANHQCDQSIELVISGSGERQDELETQISAADHSDCIHLLGFLQDREQVYRMMDEIDIYAMPSRWEGFCVAALEAMAVGNACVFSEIPEFTDPFEEVALFHPVDDVNALSERLTKLIEDSEHRSSLAEQATTLVRDRYSLQHTAEQYVQLYQSSVSD